MERSWTTQDMTRSEPFQHVPTILIVILSFPDIWAGERCPVVLFTCVSSISSPPIFSQPTPIWTLPCHFTSDLKMLLNLMGDFQFPSYLVLPLSLQCIPFSWLLSVCIPPAYPGAPFWLFFDFLFFQCPLNDNLSLSLKDLSGALVFLTLHVP